MMSLSIGQAADKSGCTPPTIRYYESIGLLPVAVWQAVINLNERFGLVLFLVLPGLLLALASQIYRYWRVSGPLARQQTKWFIFGLTIFVAMFPLSQLVPILRRIEAINGSLSLAIIPLTIGIALLRYRLWDVDVVVRRTVGYAILTACWPSSTSARSLSCNASLPP